MSKTCLITGVTGQDGAYLSRLLLDKGYEVWGAYRRNAQDINWRLDVCGARDQVKMVPLELLEPTNILRVLEQTQPDEVYHLAAQSNVGESFEQPVYTGEVTALGTARLLEAIRTVNPKIRFYQASSSEMFGVTKGEPHKETTPFHPRSPYAAAKLYAHWATVNYRESYGMYAVSGICFNHESPLRGLDFVTRKTTHAVARIKHGLQRKLSLGSLTSQRDWGYAPEYVEAMWRMLQQDAPDDYVVATGEAHSVQDFVEASFAAAGLDWREHVETDSAFVRPNDVDLLVGDASKAREKLGWEPTVRFAELTRIMVASDMEAVAKGAAAA